MSKGTDIGRMALCGDVAYTFKNIEGKIPIGGVDPQEWHATMSKLKESDVLLPGHDPDIVKRWTMDPGFPIGSKLTSS